MSGMKRWIEMVGWWGGMVIGTVCVDPRRMGSSTRCKEKRVIWGVISFESNPSGIDCSYCRDINFEVIRQKGV